MKNESDNRPGAHKRAIREHTDGRQFRPWWLLAVTLGVAAIMALISYAIQLIYIGPG